MTMELRKMRLELRTMRLEHRRKRPGRSMIPLEHRRLLERKRSLEQHSLQIHGHLLLPEPELRIFFKDYFLYKRKDS